VERSDTPSTGSDESDDDFVSRLALKRVDRDIFTGWCHAGAPLRAFGGQVAAQALVAAGRTIDDPDRRVHSLHGYFLRPGRTTDHIVYLVDRPRDGRSFSTRRVRAVQYGETIFTMSASFAIDQNGPRHGGDTPPPWWHGVPEPDQIPPEDVLSHVRLPETTTSLPEQLSEAGYPRRQLLDLRHVDNALVREISGGTVDQMNWIRSQPLPDEHLVQVCALTYFSDLTLVRTVLGHHGGSAGTKGVEIASIDHAMWFHAPLRADDWQLFANRSPVAGGGHGFAIGSFHTMSGHHVASVAQEVLVREPPGRQRD
jgi:acyl-CoA thioesterase-2